MTSVLTLAPRWSALALAVPGTARAMRWRPFLALAGVLSLAAVLSRQSDRPAGALLALASAALASSVVAGLHDPASRLLAPVPVSRVLRRLVRVALVGVPALGLWWLLTSVVAATEQTRSPVPLLALAAAGVAATVWAPERYGVLVGSLVPALWFALGLLPVGDGIVADVALAWRTDAWVVLGLALLAALARGRTR